MRTAIAYTRSRRNAQIEYSGRRRVAVRSEDMMTWEWEHRSNRGQWTLTVGVWHAVVHRVAGSRPQWQATLTRTMPLYERRESPPYPEALDARTWCLRTIAALADNVV